MNESRSKNTTRNMIFGFGMQLIQTLFPFILRTIFIYTLGTNYLGINSLFASVLSVLSLAELGIGNVLIYSLYKPLADKDSEKVVSLIKFYKKIYRVIALIVFVLGISLLPFLHLIVNLPDDIENIRLYYVLFVLDSAVSYLLIYKSSIINADQKQYIVSMYRSISTIVLTIVQAVLLIVTKNYLFYLIIQIIITFLTNFFISIKANKLYELNKKDIKDISKEEQKHIFNNTKAMLSYKIGGTILNSTDSIYISSMISTVTLGLYTNYTVLVQVLNKFINIIYDSLYASVGNLNVTEEIEKKKIVFDALCFCFNLIASIGFCGFVLCANRVIIIWLGNNFLIDNFSIIALGISFFLPTILNPVWMYRNSTGLFKETKNILIYAAIFNMILSFIFGKLWGLAGIIIATSVSRIATSFWYEPYILFKKVFRKDSCMDYFKKIFISFIICVITLVIGYGLDNINGLNNILKLIIEVLISILIPLGTFYLIYHKKDYFKYMYEQFIKKYINKIKSKIIINH